jgi:hypothetical protein
VRAPSATRLVNLLIRRLSFERGLQERVALKRVDAASACGRVRLSFLNQARLEAESAAPRGLTLERFAQLPLGARADLKSGPSPSPS